MENKYINRYRTFCKCLENLKKSRKASPNDNSLTIYDLIPGETYVLTFQDGAWQMKKKDKSSQPVCWQNDTVENK